MGLRWSSDRMTLNRFPIFPTRRRMPNFFKRGGSAVAGKTLSDLIKPSIECVKSGMKGFVVKVKDIADCYHSENPTVMLQVHKSVFGRAPDESDEAQQEIHSSQLR
jgi:hypothetical protein